MCRIICKTRFCTTLVKYELLFALPQYPLSFPTADAQAQLAVAVEKERAATEELLSIKSQLVSLESQNSLLRQEKARCQVQLEAEKSKREKVEDESSR